MRESNVSIVSLRMVREASAKYGAVRYESAEEVYFLFRDLMGDLARESAWVVCLDAKLKLTNVSMVSLGSVRANVVGLGRRKSLPPR